MRAQQSDDIRRYVRLTRSQPYDERLREVSLATMDAKLLGVGFLMILPDNNFKYVPLDKISVKL